MNPSTTTTTAPEVQTTPLPGGGIMKIEDVTYKSLTLMPRPPIDEDKWKKCLQEAAEKRESHKCYYHCTQYGLTYELQPGTHCGINKEFGACFMDMCLARPKNAEALTCEFRAKLGTKGRGFALLPAKLPCFIKCCRALMRVIKCRLLPRLTEKCLVHASRRVRREYLYAYKPIWRVPETDP